MPDAPEIWREGPFSCPICGMALEPETATAEAGPNHELADMTCRFWIGLALAAPMFLLEMGSHLMPAIHHGVPSAVSIRIQFALGTPVVLWAGWPFFVRGSASVVSRNLNMFTLIAMGTGVVAWAAFGPEPSYAYGLVAAVAVLITACPCALRLATPMSIMVGVGTSAMRFG